AWAAGELARQWGRGLDYLGAAALAPPTDLGSLVDEVPDDLSPQQQALYPVVLTSLQLRHPELDFADYLSGGALAALPTVSHSCDNTVFTQFPPADFTPRSPEVLKQARAWLDELALPTRPAGPLFVAAGTADSLVPVHTVDAAVERACAFGDPVEYRRYPGAGHPALPAAGPDSLRWIADRFAGLPAPSTCGTVISPAVPQVPGPS
ncbi:MAG: lipase family protein, partial [Actinomycetota bacterium]|nr:lipase family protein [Actinomycetota bacterium]